MPQALTTYFMAPASLPTQASGHIQKRQSIICILGSHQPTTRASISRHYGNSKLVDKELLSPNVEQSANRLILNLHRSGPYNKINYKICNEDNCYVSDPNPHGTAFVFRLLHKTRVVSLVKVTRKHLKSRSLIHNGPTTIITYRERLSAP